MPENPSLGIETYYWKGQKRYRCPVIWTGTNARCAFDTYSIDHLKDHMREDHKNEIGLKTQTNPIPEPHHNPDPEFEKITFKNDLDDLK